MRSRSSLFAILACLAIVISACTPPQVSPEEAALPSESATAPETASQPSVAAQKEAAPASAPIVETFEPACEDTDGGSSTAAIGTVSGTDENGEPYVQADDCISPLAQREYSCEGGVARSRITQCSCTAGACIAALGAPSLADYPSFLDGSVLIVVGDEAPAQHVQAAITLATTLTVSFSNEVKTVLAREVPPSPGNLILIGDACDNEYVAQLLGPKDDCSAGEITGEGVIEVKKDGSGDLFVFITGGSSDDIRKAAKVLGEHSQYTLSGSREIVGGSLSNPTLV